MWLTIGLAYCAVCWLLGLLLTRTAWWADATAGADSRGRLAAVEWAVVLFAPIVLLFSVVLFARCLISAFREQQLLERSLRTFRAYEFVQVTYPHLDDSIREPFDRH